MTRKNIHNTADQVSEAERRVRYLLLITLLILFVALLWSGWWFLKGRLYISSNDAYVTGNMTPVEDQTPGTLSKVLVENTEYVQAGQVMAVLQGHQAHLRLLQAEAQLGATVRRVGNDFSEVTQLQYVLTSKRMQWKRLQGDWARYTASLPSGAVSAIKVQDIRQEMLATQAQVAAEKAKLRGVSAIVVGTTLASNPLVRQAQATLELADIQWQRRIIQAPIAGYVAERSAYAGLVVHSGQRLFTVVPLNDLWVVANIKETRMAQVRPGQRVTLTSYYYGDSVRYRGIVLGLLPGAGSAFSILPPENATGNYIHIVERVPVRIAPFPADLRAHPLRPGLSMVADIHLDHSRYSVWQPLTKTPGQDYQTTIHAQELQRARQLVDKIVHENAQGIRR